MSMTWLDYFDELKFTPEMKQNLRYVLPIKQYTDQAALAQGYISAFLKIEHTPKKLSSLVRIKEKITSIEKMFDGFFDSEEQFLDSNFMKQLSKFELCLASLQVTSIQKNKKPDQQLASTEKKLLESLQSFINAEKAVNFINKEALEVLYDFQSAKLHAQSLHYNLRFFFEKFEELKNDNENLSFNQKLFYFQQILSIENQYHIYDGKNIFVKFILNLYFYFCGLPSSYDLKERFELIKGKFQSLCEENAAAILINNPSPFLLNFFEQNNLSKSKIGGYITHRYQFVINDLDDLKKIKDLSEFLYRCDLIEQTPQEFFFNRLSNLTREEYAKIKGFCQSLRFSNPHDVLWIERGLIRFFEDSSKKIINGYLDLKSKATSEIERLSTDKEAQDFMEFIYEIDGSVSLEQLYRLVPKDTSPAVLQEVLQKLWNERKIPTIMEDQTNFLESFLMRLDTIDLFAMSNSQRQFIDNLSSRNKVLLVCNQLKINSYNPTDLTKYLFKHIFKMTNQEFEGMKDHFDEKVLQYFLTHTNLDDLTSKNHQEIILKLFLFFLQSKKDINFSIQEKDRILAMCLPLVKYILDFKLYKDVLTPLSKLFLCSSSVNCKKLILTIYKTIMVKDEFSSEAFEKILAHLPFSGIHNLELIDYQEISKFHLLLEEREKIASTEWLKLSLMETVFQEPSYIVGQKDLVRNLFRAIDLDEKFLSSIIFLSEAMVEASKVEDEPTLFEFFKKINIESLKSLSKSHRSVLSNKFKSIFEKKPLCNSQLIESSFHLGSQQTIDWLSDLFINTKVFAEKISDDLRHGDFHSLPVINNKETISSLLFLMDSEKSRFGQSLEEGITRLAQEKPEIISSVINYCDCYESTKSKKTDEQDSWVKRIEKVNHEVQSVAAKANHDLSPIYKPVDQSMLDAQLTIRSVMIPKKKFLHQQPVPSKDKFFFDTETHVKVKFKQVPQSFEKTNKELVASQYELLASIPIELRKSSMFLKDIMLTREQTKFLDYDEYGIDLIYERAQLEQVSTNRDSLKKFAEVTIAITLIQEARENIIDHGFMTDRVVQSANYFRVSSKHKEVRSACEKICALKQYRKDLEPSSHAVKKMD